MGYYVGQRDRPCPRCGGVVTTVFISVAPMSFRQSCQGCGASDFTPDEDARLGDNVLRRTPLPTADDVRGILRETE